MKMRTTALRRVGADGDCADDRYRHRGLVGQTRREPPVAHRLPMALSHQPWAGRLQVYALMRLPIDSAPAAAR